MIAALYIDANGPYPHIPGIDCWDIDRDATQYNGEGPLILHPPCGHWGRYSHKAYDDGHTDPLAVAQVRKRGGVLEHPKDSKLWAKCGIPKPGNFPTNGVGIQFLCFREIGDTAQTRPLGSILWDARRTLFLTSHCRNHPGPGGHQKKGRSGPKKICPGIGRGPGEYSNA